MNGKHKVEDKLTRFVHDIFLDLEYKSWRNKLFNFELDRWYSLIVELDKSQVALSRVKEFNESIYSKLVFRCIRSPNWKNTGEIMIIFNVSGMIWSSLVFQTPKKETD